MDDQLYIDVRNRMQSLLARPDVEALMSSAQEESKRDEHVNSGDTAEAISNEEQKQEAAEPKREISFKIADDDDDEEEEKNQEAPMDKVQEGE